MSDRNLLLNFNIPKSTSFVHATMSPDENVFTKHQYYWFYTNANRICFKIMESGNDYLPQEYPKVHIAGMIDVT